MSSPQPTVDETAVGASDEKAGEVAKACEVKATLETLSDELLAAICEQVSLLHRFDQTSTPVSKLAVNKRFYAIAKKQYDSTLIPTCSAHRNEAFPNLLDKLLDNPTTDLPLRQLHFSSVASTFHFDLRIVARLRNLTSIFLNVDNETPRQWSATLNAIKELKSLKEFVIRDETEGDPAEVATLDLKADLPALRVFEFRSSTDESKVALNILAGDNSNLEVLRLAFNTNLGAIWNRVPWFSLQVLQVYNVFGRLPEANSLVTSLRSALGEDSESPVKLALRELVLAPPPSYVGGQKERLHAQLGAVTMTALTKQLQRTSISKLHLVGHLSVSNELPSVEHVVLRWRTRLNDNEKHKPFAKLITGIKDNFPSLTILDCEDFLVEEESEGDLAAQRNFEFVLKNPLLFAFLGFLLQQTEVRRFTWRCVDECDNKKSVWTWDDSVVDFSGDTVKDGTGDIWALA